MILLPNAILLHGVCFPHSTVLSGNKFGNYGTLKADSVGGTVSGLKNDFAVVTF